MPCLWQRSVFMPSVGGLFGLPSIRPVSALTVLPPLHGATIATLADTSTIERRAIRIGIFTCKQRGRSAHHDETRKAGSTGPAYDNSNWRIACKPQWKLSDHGPRGISSHDLRGPRRIPSTLSMVASAHRWRYFAATRTHVARDRSGEKRASERRDQNRTLVHTEIVAGEIGLPTPKEQPPRKLSGKRTAMIDVSGKRRALRPPTG